MFEGGAGEISPGIEDRSNDSGDLDRFCDRPPGEDAPETGGEACRPSVCRGGSCVATDISNDSFVVKGVVDRRSCSSGSRVSWSDESCGLAMAAERLLYGLTKFKYCEQK